MADLEFTDADLAELLGSVAPVASETDAELAALCGESNDVPDLGLRSEATPTTAYATAASPPSASLASPAATAATHGSSRLEAEYSWVNALHLVPGFQRLLARYPAIGLSDHRKHGRVLLAAYMEDTSRRVRRNLKLGEHMFFHAPELEVFEPETKVLKCRIIIKVLPYEVGMKIRYWENTPAGDVPGKSGIFQLAECGLVRLGAGKVAKR